MSTDDRADLGSVDYYAVLGVAPTSEDVVIRAAYHALMRRYHPDANASAKAAARARELTAAYSVLSDPDERARYDALRSGQAPPEPPRRRPPGFFFALGSGVALIAALGALFVTPLVPPAEADRTGDKPAQPVVSAGAPSSVPAAAASRQVSVVAPPARPAEVQRTAVQVASLPERQPEAREESRVPRAERSAPAAQMAERKIATAPTAVAAKGEAAEATPSFSCQHAKGRGEKAVCESADLATLDRSLAMLYSQSYGPAGTEKRPRLVQARERFLARRDGCRSDACMTEAYLGHMREISDIMRRDSEAAR